VDVNRAKLNIARQFYYRASHDVQQAMNYVARTVRREYWNLDHAYRVENIQSLALVWAQKTYEDENKRFEIGASTQAHVAQSHELFQRYRILELDAQQNVIEQERRIRQPMGLPGFDEKRFTIPNGSAPKAPKLD